MDEDFRANARDAFLHATLGTAMLVERAVAAGVRIAVYVSTSHVYGSPVGIQDEGTTPAPMSDYAIAHFASERLFARVYEKLAILLLRPNAVFGLPESLDTFDRWSLIPFSFPLEAANHAEIRLKSSGEQYRNFVSTDDSRRRRRLPHGGAIARGASAEFTGGRHHDRPLTRRRCALVYERLTGAPCEVRCPPSAKREHGIDFIYSSLTPVVGSRRGIDDYLVELFSRLLEELKHGRRYGT